MDVCAGDYFGIFSYQKGDNTEMQGEMAIRKKLFMMVGLLIFILLPHQLEVFAAIDNLDDKIEKMEAEIERNMEIHNIPGMAYALVDAEGVLFSGGYGVLDISEGSQKIDGDTNFHIGSLSKVFVSLAVMKLQEENRISINKPVVDYLPWFSTKDNQLSDEITIRHLLSHTSGLPGRLNVHAIEKRDRQEIISEVEKMLEDVTLEGKPGEHYEYTNMNTDILQLLIEEVTGETFTAYMENNIFSPLQMNRTGYFIFEDSHLPNTAMGHRYHWEKLKPYDEQLVYATSGSAGMSSNVDDLSKFIRLVLSEGENVLGETVIDEGSLNEMFLPVRDRMAYNWYVHSHNMYMEGGLPGFTSAMVISADKSFGLVLLSNSKQDITLDTGFNLFKIAEGKVPEPLLLSDYSTKNPEAQILLGMSAAVTLLTVVLLMLSVIQLKNNRRTFSFEKPGWRKISLIGALIAIYSGVMYYLHIYAPFQIGVPTIFSFQKEPDFVAGILILSVVSSIFSAVLLGRLLFLKKL